MTELISSYYTTAGVSPAEGGGSRHPFEERVRACAEAGYSGIGIHVRDYRLVRSHGLSDADMQTILQNHGMRHIEIEFLLNWFADGQAGEVARQDEATLFHMAETFGARVMLLGGDMTPGNSRPLEELAPRFSALCARAREHGLTVGVEACAWTNIGILDDALDLISAAGAPNAGAYIDVWHLYRRDYDYGRLKALGADQIAGIQLGDAARHVTGTLPEDSLDHRLLPGDGDADVAAFVASVLATGYEGPLSVEILSIAQRALPLADAAGRSFEAARRAIREGGGA